MAKVLILGGGFGGVAAADHLAKKLDGEHEITLVSRSRRFVFSPALVRLAFGKTTLEDVSFDLRQIMGSRRVDLLTAEVVGIVPEKREVIIARGEIENCVPYDYLVYALGRSLAADKIAGFSEHAHHVLTVDKALQFGQALDHFHEGRALIGQCPGARLPVPVYETAFALSQLLEERNERNRVKISVVGASAPGVEFGDNDCAGALRTALNAHGIELLPNFSISRITFGAAYNSLGQSIKFNLLMLLPPFEGPPAVSSLGIRNAEGYINVNEMMQVVGAERMYAVGDCVNFKGPKMARMSIKQAKVAAANLVSEIEGRRPTSTYNHELNVVIDEGSSRSIYVHKNLSPAGPAKVRQGRLWTWTKRLQQRHWRVSA